MKIVKKTLLYILSIAFAIVFGFPIVLTFVMSFKSLPEYMMGNYWGLPNSVYLGNWSKILSSDFNIYFLNSFIVSFTSVVLSTFVASMAAFVFSRLKFKGSGVLMSFFLIGMMIPSHTMLIPIYQLQSSLHLTDTRIGLVLPYVSLSISVAIYIIYTYMNTIPRELDESATIDGASSFRTYLQIIMPLAKPGISTVLIYNFLFYWNEFIFSLTLINSKAKKTLPLGIREFYGAETVNIPSVLTAILFGSLPVLLLYLFAQEQVISGLSAGAVKG